MAEYTPRWLGVIRGFRTSGRDPWQVSIEMPEGPGIYEGTGPTVVFDRGQTVHVLTDEGIAEVERAAAEKAWEDGVAIALNHAKRGSDGISLALLTREGSAWDNPYRKDKTDD